MTENDAFTFITQSESDHFSNYLESDGDVKNATRQNFYKGLALSRQSTRFDPAQKGGKGKVLTNIYITHKISLNFPSSSLTQVTENDDDIGVLFLTNGTGTLGPWPPESVGDADTAKEMATRGRHLLLVFVRPARKSIYADCHAAFVSHPYPPYILDGIEADRAPFGLLLRGCVGSGLGC